MKKKLILVLFIAFALAFVMISCDSEKTYIDQSNVLPTVPTYIQVSGTTKKGNFVAYDALARLGVTIAEDIDPKLLTASGSKKAQTTPDYSKLKLTDEEEKIIYGKDIKTYKDFEIITAEDVADMPEADDTVADDGGALSDLFSKIGKIALEKIKGIVLGSASKYITDFLTDVFTVHYSQKSSQLDHVYAKVESLSQSLENISNAITENDMRASFKDIYGKMNAIKSQVTRLYGERGVDNGNIYKLMNDPAILSQMQSSSKIAKQFIQQAFTGAKVNPETFMNDVINVMRSMHSAITTNNHNYYELLDYIVRKTYPWEKQGFALREALRTSDCLALKDAVVALNLYSNVVDGSSGEVTREQLNKEFALYLDMLDNTKIDYTDNERNYAVCNITNARVKIQKDQKFKEVLFPISYQIYLLFLYHANAYSGPGINGNWIYSTPSEYDNGASISKNPNYFYYFKTDLIKKYPDVFKQEYIDYMKNLQQGVGNKPILKLAADKSEEIGEKIKNCGYFDAGVITAISDYYGNMAASGKKLTLDRIDINDETNKACAEKVINNNFLYAMIDGGVFDADDVVEWYAMSTEDALKTSGMTDKNGNVFLSYYHQFRKPEHDVALLYNGGTIAYRRGKKETDLIWYSMFRTSDNKLFKEYNQYTEDYSVKDRENLVNEHCNISRGDYISGADYNIWRHYFHPIIKHETYVIKGDLQ